MALACAAAVSAFGAAGAQAAAQLELTVGGPPPVLAPGGSGFGQMTFTNTGDANVASGAATVTVELPDGLTATATSFPTSGGAPPRWVGCSIEPVDRQVITCTGPTTNYQIAAGSSMCALFGFLGPETCPIGVTVKADDSAPKGSYETTIEACVTGAPPCTTATATTVIQDFGDDFGFAPINQPGAETVPAIPENQAFWAGACERASAPAFGDPIAPPGQGSIPSTIWAPAFVSAPPNRVVVPAPPTASHCIDLGEPTLYPDGGEILEPGIWLEHPDWRLPPVAQAGSHPDGSTTMAFARNAANEVDGAIDNIYVDLPAGFVGNPNAVPKCTAEEFAVKPPLCPASSQVGMLHLLIRGRPAGHSGHGTYGSYKVYPIWNLEPRQGRVAELGFAYASGEEAVSVRLTGKARTAGDFGVTAFTGQIPAALEPIIQTVTLWGVPWAAINDIWRAPTGMEAHFSDPCIAPPAGAVPGYIPFTGFTVAGCATGYDPSWGPVRPFLTQETDCNPSPVVKGWTDSYQDQGAFTADGDPDAGDADWKTATSAQAPVTGCAGLPFAPDSTFAPTSVGPDSASGLDVQIAVPQNNTPPQATPALSASGPVVDQYVSDATAHWKSAAGLATAHLKDSVVTLPAGMSVNPSGATGLEACSDDVIGVRDAASNPVLFNNADPFDGQGTDCPDGSKIGTVSVKTPLLDDPVAGEVVLGSPKSTDPESGQMFRLFLVLRDENRGLLAKIYGTTTADKATGRLKATFQNNPELPFDTLDLDIKGGDRGLLAMPQSCGAKSTEAVFTPWSAAHGGGGASKSDSSPFTVAGDCSNAFVPSLAAGMDTQAARSNGTFSFKFGRSEGQQYLSGLTAKLPQGLLASVKDVPLCSNAAANAGACPAGSKIGVVDAKAGSGDPFVLEEKGEVFLTDGYKGGEYGLAVKIRPIAGPFRGALELSPIIVRQAIHVDRKTAQVTAVSDPLPLIHHGVPLRVREVTVLVNRGQFMLNPSDCAAKQVGAALNSDQGAVSNASNVFEASGCSSLAFKPKLALRLTGRKQVRTGKHPGIRAVVTQKGISEAGIEKAEVRLPKSLALDVDNAQALCEFEDGTKPDLENHCPKGSIVGRARAVSPLLNDPLVGNVYFVKNVRRSASGNLIRTLPMIVVALRGEIAVNLVGESNVDKGKLVNTFDDVPDAPITRFNLNINGGKNGIIAVTRTRRSLINLCSGRHIAEADIDGHNGRRYDRDIRMKTPCTKKQTKAAKRKAKRAAAKRAAREAARRS